MKPPRRGVWGAPVGPKWPKSDKNSQNRHFWPKKQGGTPLGPPLRAKKASPPHFFGSGEQKTSKTSKNHVFWVFFVSDGGVFPQKNLHKFCHIQGPPLGCAQNWSFWTLRGAKKPPPTPFFGGPEGVFEPLRPPPGPPWGSLGGVWRAQKPPREAIFGPSGGVQDPLQGGKTPPQTPLRGGSGGGLTPLFIRDYS